MTNTCVLGHPWTAGWVLCPTCGFGRRNLPAAQAAATPVSAVEEREQVLVGAAAAGSGGGTSEWPAAPAAGAEPPAPAGEATTATGQPVLSPDGYWAWDGSEWVPAAQLLGTMPVPADLAQTPEVDPDGVRAVDEGGHDDPAATGPPSAEQENLAAASAAVTAALAAASARRAAQRTAPTPDATPSGDTDGADTTAVETDAAGADAPTAVVEADAGEPVAITEPEDMVGEEVEVAAEIEIEVEVAAEIEDQVVEPGDTTDTPAPTPVGDAAAEGTGLDVDAPGDRSEPDAHAEDTSGHLTETAGEAEAPTVGATPEPERTGQVAGAAPDVIPADTAATAANDPTTGRSELDPTAGEGEPAAPVAGTTRSKRRSRKRNRNRDRHLSRAELAEAGTPGTSPDADLTEPLAAEPTDAGEATSTSSDAPDGDATIDGAEPAGTTSTGVDPVDTELTGSEPVETEPTDTEPVATADDAEPVEAEPVATADDAEPVDTEPVDTDTEDGRSHGRRVDHRLLLAGLVVLTALVSSDLAFGLPPLGHSDAASTSAAGAVPHRPTGKTPPSTRIVRQAVPGTASTPSADIRTDVTHLQAAESTAFRRDGAFTADATRLRTYGMTETAGDQIQVGFRSHTLCAVLGSPAKPTEGWFLLDNQVAHAPDTAYPSAYAAQAACSGAVGTYTTIVLG